ncbi:MAG: hypothetical protein ACKKL4_01280 [Patescibacteria group bacterium]
MIYDIGYLGLFLFSFVNGFNLIIPFVPTSFMPVLLDGGFQFWPSVIVMSIGMSSADIIGFLIGRYISRFDKVDTLGVLNFLQSIRERSYYGPLIFTFFFGSLVPLPFELMMVPLGIMRYRIGIIFAISFSANMIFNIITAVGFIQLFAWLF